MHSDSIGMQDRTRNAPRILSEINIIHMMRNRRQRNYPRPDLWPSLVSVPDDIST